MGGLVTSTILTLLLMPVLFRPDSYHQRTRIRFEGLEKDLAKWSSANNGAKVLQRLQARMHACTKFAPRLKA